MDAPKTNRDEAVDYGVAIYAERADRARLWALGKRNRRSIKGQLAVILDEWCQTHDIDSAELTQEYDDGKG